MSNQYVFNDRLPLAPLKIAALESCRDLAQKVNDHIVNFRRNDAEELLRRQGNLQYRGYDVDSYLLDCACPRFGSGEAKGIVNESVRGTDIFCMVDVTNHSLTYKMSGYVNHMSPDDHYQDLKRIIGATASTITFSSNILAHLLNSLTCHNLGILMVFMPTISTFAISELLTMNNIKLFGTTIQLPITLASVNEKMMMMKIGEKSSSRSNQR